MSISGPAIDEVVEMVVQHYVRTGDPILKMGIGAVREATRRQMIAMAEKQEYLERFPKYIKDKIIQGKKDHEQKKKGRQMLNRIYVGDDGQVREVGSGNNHRERSNKGE